MQDSGENQHLFVKQANFHIYIEVCDLPICTVIPNAMLTAKGEGSVLVYFHCNGLEIDFLLKNILHAPNATENVISQHNPRCACHPNHR